MTDYQSIECLQCHKRGPYLGGLNEEDKTWFLACLWCGNPLKTTEQIVRAQISFQQKVAGHRCPGCGVQALSKGSIEDDPANMTFICENCGFKEKMTPQLFENYMMHLGGKLNP